MIGLRPIAAIALLAGATLPASAQRDETADRAAIHALLVAYGSTLDARDFAGFGRLFGKDGVYAAGGGAEARGPATGEMMRKVFAGNAMGFAEPNYHLFFNEVVTFTGSDSATATSMSLYVVPDDRNRPTPMLMAAYEDDLVREDGRWVFARRSVKGLMPTHRP
ncbi:nuclear transport factor 2 family protein [Sphingobium sp. B11D3D]|uniref:nuclear transport factor 2 family protein n=1 Tax=Sphingobium sp. B11D3D TaxID=2940576 RepID=UPI0022240735|nr:nuclear transport factor 2 family protein [Sphingobium sp. B11D3D]MCW2368212.1 hypothetical protein [Sphingobium sp. B11D3D]